MISVKEAEEIHRILINTFGGSHGIRDLNGLESALARPFQIFGNEELYSTVILKATALLESHSPPPSTISPLLKRAGIQKHWIKLILTTRF